MTRPTAVAAPAQPPDADYLLAQIATLSLGELLVLRKRLEELIRTTRRQQGPRSPSPPTTSS